MPNPFDQFDSKSAKGNPFDRFDAAASPDGAQQWEHLSVLPFDVSKDGQDFRFNSDAGIVGSIKRAFTLPGDVATGKIDPLSNEGISRAADLAALSTPAGAAANAGEGVALLAAKAKPKTPTARELKSAGKAGYDAAKELGVDFQPAAVNQMAQRIQASLNSDGLLSEIAPATHSIIGKLSEEQPSGAVAPFESLVAARQALGRISRSIDPATRAPTQDAAAASRAVDALDAFLSNPPASAVATGPAGKASDLLKEANANYAAALRSNRITDKADVAELRASAANSGHNVGNSLRQRTADIVGNPKLSAGYSPEELAALQNVIHGSPLRNATRFTANLLGGGGGLGAVVTGGIGGAAGAATGGPLGALAGMAAPAVGIAAKAAENSMTRKAVEKAADLVRQRSPLYRGLLSASPTDYYLSPAQQLLVRGLLSSDWKNH